MKIPYESLVQMLEGNATNINSVPALQIILSSYGSGNIVDEGVL